MDGSEEKDLLSLYFSRDEKAIENTRKKYGRLFYGLARNILRSEEDAEECVNDALFVLWNRIPPEKPENFTAFGCRVLKNIALKKSRRLHAEKRNPEYEISLSELAEICPAPDSTEAVFDAKATAAMINEFLRSLDEEKRFIFIRRYWYHDDIGAIARATGSGEGRIRTTLFRLRTALAEHLKEGGAAL